MSLNIQTATGLLEIGGKVTKEKVISALGYEPADKTHTENTTVHVTSAEKEAWNAKADQTDLDAFKSEISESIGSESDNLVIVDNNGNIIMQVDADGVSTTNVNTKTIELNGKDLGERLDEIEAISLPNILDNETGDLTIADESGNVVMKVNADGLETTTVTAKNVVVNGKDIVETIDTHISNKTVHVTEAQKTTWDNKSDFSGDYNDLTNKPNIIDDGSGEVVYSDDEGYVIAKINASGFETTNITAKSAVINGVNITTKLDEHNEDIKSVGENLSAHTTNSDIHITAIERESWTTSIDKNAEDIGKLNTSLSSHTSDSTAHITDDERTLWNNKSDFSGDYADLTNAPDIVEDASGEIVYADESGNIIAKINENGFETTQVIADTVIAGGTNIGSTLSSHTGNNDIHITNEERTAWNDKADKTYVDETIAALVDSSPEALNTLNELAAALGDDPNFATTVTNEIAKKADKTSLDTHIDNKSNPHNVTKAQVGLGNVDNTSDADKPVSTAQQAALNNLKNELSETIVSESKEWIVADENGNIVAKVDENGLETTVVTAKSVIVNGTDVETALSNKAAKDHTHNQYLEADDIEGFATTEYVDQQLTTKANADHTHSQYLVANDIDGKADKSYVDAELDKKANSEHTHEQYLEADDIADLATTSYVDTELTKKAEKEHSHDNYLEASDIVNKADKSYVDEELNKKANSTHTHEQYLEANDIEGLATEEYVNEAITNAQLADKEVDLSGYYTKDETDTKIEEAIDAIIHPVEDLATTEYVNAQLATKADKIHTHDEYLTSDDITNKADKSYVDEEINTAIDKAKEDAANKDAVILFETQKGISAVQTVLDAHTDSTDIHITSDERISWNNKADKVYVDEELSKKADSGHIHTQYLEASDIEGLATTSYVNTELAKKADASHTHNEYLTSDDIVDKTDKSYVDAELAKKSDSTHTHEQYLEASDISGKADKSYVDEQVATKANTSHTHKVENITDLTATATELNYMDGVTSSVQMQLDNKANKATTLEGYGITDAASKTYVDTLIEGLTTEGTADAALVQAALTAHTNDTANPHGVTLSQLGVTATDVELNYVSGVTSNIQNQINDKANANHTHEQYLQASDISGKADKTYVDEEIDNAINEVKIDAANKNAVVLAETQKGINTVQTALDTHIESNVHITSDERTTWNGKADKDYVDTELAKKASSEHTHDEYLVESDIADKADKSYVDEELVKKVSATRKINNKELSTDIILTANDIGALPDTTVIPSIDGLATEEYVTNKIAEAKLAASDVDLSGYYTKTETDTKIEEAISAIEHPVDDLATIAYVDEQLESKASSDHTHSQYLTEDDIANKADKSELHTHDNKGELDKIIEGKVAYWDAKSDFSGAYADLEGAPNITEDNSGDLIIADNDGNIIFRSNGAGFETTTVTAQTVVVDGTDIKTALDGKADSSHTHDEYLTAIPDEYITETELDTKGYLTQHQDLSDYAKKSDLNPYATTEYVDSSLQNKVDKTTLNSYYTKTEIDNKGYAVSTDVENTYAKKIDVNTELAKKVDSAEISHSTDTVAEGATIKDGKLSIVVDSYTKAETLTKIQEKITEINGGESAGEVLSALNSYIETNDARVGAIAEKNNTQDGAISQIQQNILSLGTNKADKTYVDEQIDAVKVDASNKDAVVLFEAQKGINVVQTALDIHTNNTDIHITSDERITWNKKADKSYVDGLSDALAGKADKATTLEGYGIIDAYTDVQVDDIFEELADSISAHENDTEYHITADERDAWNAKSDFSGKYNDLENKPNIEEDESGDLTITDNDGNIIFRTDAEGLITTNLAAKSIVVNGMDVETKLNKLEDKVEVQSDWNETDEASKAFILNKPEGLATETYVDEKVASINYDNLANRPTYTDDIYKREMIPSGVGGSFNWNSSLPGYVSSIITDFDTSELIDKPLVVTWDGIDYPCRFTESDDGYILGDYDGALSGNGVGSGESPEPFAMLITGDNSIEVFSVEPTPGQTVTDNSITMIDTSTGFYRHGFPTNFALKLAHTYLVTYYADSNKSYVGTQYVGADGTVYIGIGNPALRGLGENNGSYFFICTYTKSDGTRTTEMYTTSSFANMTMSITVQHSAIHQVTTATMAISEAISYVSKIEVKQNIIENSATTEETYVRGILLPPVTTVDNGKIIEVVNGKYVLRSFEESSFKTKIDEYINSKLGT